MKRTTKKKDKAGKKKSKLVESTKSYTSKDSKKHKPYKGNTETMVSTGSTLLDLAISGTRVRGGGLPGGILVEAFGPPGSGKTVLLCESAGYIQRLDGEALFNDPEARLNKQFARMFDLSIEDMTLTEPDTVTEVFQHAQAWEPESKAPIHGIFTDSLAALSTDMEMDSKEGDKMGMRRAKELSEGLRKFCRVLKQKNYIMMCSNQVRVNVGAGMFEEKVKTPGGEAVGFYASVRLRHSIKKKIKKEVSFRGKKISKVIGIIADIQVYKNSVDAPYRSAEVYILFDYGIDDIRANLQFLKDYSSKKVYFLNDRDLDKSIDKAIAIVESEELEDELKEAVTDLWMEMQEKFKVERKPKKR